jgi:hypothetical protein
MKKIFLIVLIVVLVLLASLFVVPIIFKKQISEVVKKELSIQLKADVNFGSVGVTLFKNFPSLSLSLNDLSVINTTDTLISLKRFVLDMDAWKAIAKQEIVVEQLLLDAPRLKYITGVAIENTMQEPEAIEDTTSTNVKVSIKNFTVVDGMLHYKDTTEKMEAILNCINATVSGNFAQMKTLLDINFTSSGIFFAMDNTPYLNYFPASMNAKVEADLQAFRFDLQENNMSLGALSLVLDGFVQVGDSSTTMDITIDAPQTGMNDLLRMVPQAFASYLEGIKTDGSVSLEGNIKGDFIDADRLPGFDLRFTVSDGIFQYPDLPKSINKITIDAQLTHPDNTNLDAMVIRIGKFFFNFGDNPIESGWLFTTPMSDLNIDGFFKGKVDLSTIKDIVPIENAELRGIINADVTMKGKMSDIEKEQYDRFKAAGYLSMKTFWFKSNDVPQGIEINETTMNFSPEKIDLKSFSAKMGESDFTLKGQLSNYINYVFRDGTLKGSFQHYSNYINANEFLDQEDNTVTESAPVDSSNFIVPDKLDLVFNSSINRMLFDNLNISGTRGKISIKERKAILDELKMDLLSGSMVLNGVYNTMDTNNVYSDMQLTVDNIDVSQTTASFTAIRKLAPIATYTEGRISLKMNYFAPFMSNGEIDMNKLNSRGFISSPSLLVKNNSALDQLAKTTNNDRYKNLKTGPFKANYIVENGKVVIEPFTVQVEDKKMEIWGEHALNNVMDYRIKTTVAANELGKDVGNLVKLVSDPNRQLPVTVIIKGDIKKPAVSIDAKEALNQLQKDAGKGILNIFR